MQTLPAKLPALPERPSVELPRLSLEGPEDCRPSLYLHNPALIRWIFEEATIRHTARRSYQARQKDSAKDSPAYEGMQGVIFREVCTDVLVATRQCCTAYRAIEFLNEAARPRAELRHRVTCAKRRLRSKMLVAAIFCKMLREMRENNDKAENMWKLCCEGLGSLSLGLASRSLGLKAFKPKPSAGCKSTGLGSMSVSNKVFASRSLGLKSFRPCGSISLGLRRFRRVAA